MPQCPIAGDANAARVPRLYCKIFSQCNCYRGIIVFDLLPVQKTINHLPDKTLLHVFSYVRQTDLIRLAHVCKKWKLLAYDGRLWSRVSLRPDYGGLHVSNVDALVALIGARFGAALRYIELPAELVMPTVLHELANRCPNIKYMFDIYTTLLR